MPALVNISDVPVVERQHARAGLFHSQSLLGGREGSKDNFYVQLSQLHNDFFSPRHRHNFDQVRVQLVGDASFTRDGVMRPGMIGYFPEGVYYGPQENAGESKTLVLQFGGASGSGYISEERFQQGVEELKQFGTFEKGVFHRPKEGGGRKNQDAYEAVWEHIHGRKLEYPKSEHGEPVFMDPQAVAWQDEPGAAGVRRKLLGVFSARATRISVLGIAPGATATLAPHSLAFVFSGRGTAGGGEWRPHALLRTEGEAQALQAAEESEVLEIQIPPLERASA
ncbi:hypothetical protein H8N03_01480 [Ramlibacter sp. USB13]|uniref:Cupin domain-containing protein n=1 Tax=Ramlibacter cellulosilyticus TaxID=2764187 RepID=A0A923MP10_9BURK|nr:hypothetical protein [Ramlibacter cellulosilyticus]MBC5781594.1 hypothetical protein [Ramlibacter cellulosilyticus]